MQQIEERAYLENKVDSILKPLVTRMFIESPADHVSSKPHVRIIIALD